MKQCSTCLYFGARNGIVTWSTDYGDPVETNHSTCNRIIHGNMTGALSYDRVKDEPAVVTDGSGYAARLRVLPTFGCVLHETRREA